jgi:type I protein arginine methyltransferase
MYTILGYASMIADTGRLSAYARALQMNVGPTSVVMDIGSGTGIMALLACRSGASKVYAIEPDDVIRVAREVAASNGFSDRIEFHQSLSIEADLPEKVDGIVADLRGVLPMFGRSLVSMMDARDRFLKPDGWIVAARDTLWAAVVSSPVLYARFTDWSTAGGFDFAAARARATNSWRQESLSGADLLVAPRCWAALDYKTIQDRNVSGEVCWIIDRRAVGHGVSVWFDTETAPGVGFSNSPAIDEKHIYKQAFFPWPKATELEAGDEIRLSIRADFVQGEYIWTWATSVTNGHSGAVKAEYRQSTFLAAPIAPESLRKRGSSFTPKPTDDARIDQRILELMEQELTVGEIAERIESGYPSCFKHRGAALTRVGDLSSRYSKSS